MILEILTYLKADATLDGLLGSSGSDSKIYPDQAPQDLAKPYIVYMIPSEGTFEENHLEMTVSFRITSDSWLEAWNIKERLRVLLDRQDKLRDVITSVTYKIYTGKMTGGVSYKEKEMDLFQRVVIFDFKFAVL